LRERLRRYLSIADSQPFRLSKAGPVVLPDEALLHLLLNLRIRHGGDVETARVRYSEIAADSGEPEWHELCESGMIRVSWRRYQVGSSYRRSAAQETSSTPGLQQLSDLQFDEYYTFAIEPTPSYLSAAQELLDGHLRPLDIGCASPHWVASRVWDRSLDAFDIAVDQLRFWLDRWYALGSPWMSPHLDWEEEPYQRFVNAALFAIENEFNLEDWDGKRAALIRIYSARDVADPESIVAPVPATLIGRAQWLARFDGVDPLTVGSDDLANISYLLLEDVRTTAHGPGPNAVAVRLYALAATRPDLFRAVFSIHENSRVLLADALLYAPTCALACFVISTATVRVSAWDRRLLEDDLKTDLLRVFDDAVAVLSHFMRREEASYEEIAALLASLHDYRRQRGNGDREAMLTTLRREIVAQPVETVRRIVFALEASSACFQPGYPGYDAALDLISAAATDIDQGHGLVNGYIDAIRGGAYGLSARGISSRAAAHLLAVASSKYLLPALLHAVPLGADSSGTESADDPDRRARSVRMQARLLCRAIVGSRGNMPEVVVDQLEATIRSGARRDEIAGSVAAFSALYETWPVADDDRPLAADIAAAITTLQDSARNRIIDAIVRTNEPSFLAQTVSRVPRDARERLLDRLSSLVPAHAPDAINLREAQARVTALLDAELPELASLYMEEEARLSTLGPVTHRELERFGYSLRLKILRREWSEIASATIPEEIPEQAIATADQTLWFFRGVAMLANPDGDAEAAASVFASLRDRDPDNASIAGNWFAARLKMLLGSDVFVLLEGDAKDSAELLLAEVERSVVPLVRDRQSARGIDGNRGLLYLAINEPARALALFRALESEDALSAAGCAISLSRLGRAAEAAGILAEAMRRFGEQDIISSARDHVGGASSEVSTTPSFLVYDDPILHVKAALQTLRSMNPDQQARVLDATGQLEALVTGYVRLAAASVIELAPFLSETILEIHEPELNALLREILTAHLSVAGWSTSDESPGGYTPRGNPGERDLLIMSSSSTLALVEAVVCSASPSGISVRANLVRHFRKLFAYTSCRLLFHVTYCLFRDIAAVISVLEGIAENEAPTSLTFIERTPIVTMDSCPDGFVARYRGESGLFSVTFLVLDIRQQAQRQAAIESAR
jgi:hypothetical protein